MLQQHELYLCSPVNHFIYSPIHNKHISISVPDQLLYHHIHPLKGILTFSTQSNLYQRHSGVLWTLRSHVDKWKVSIIAPGCTWLWDQSPLVVPLRATGNVCPLKFLKILQGVWNLFIFIPPGEAYFIWWFKIFPG